MPQMTKFPSIEQFRNVIANVTRNARYKGTAEDGSPVFDNSLPLPTLEFEGTVKLHGTNAGIARLNGEQWFQSRERILSTTSDNAAFAAHMSVIPEADMDALFASIEAQVPTTGEHPVLVFGEWCGAGIQKGVAISNVEKMFVVFKVKVNDMWLTREQVQALVLPRANRVFHIYDFPTYSVTIDFSSPQLVQNTLGDLTLKVEEECPVGKAMGHSGVGEGIVWSYVGPEHKWRGSNYWFKVKGEKHSASKVKTLAAVDVEKLENVKTLVEMMVTENRLNQGITVMKEQGLEVTQKTTGDFLRWVFNDCVKEELDTIMANGLEPKALGGPISQKARTWYFQYLNSQPV